MRQIVTILSVLTLSACSTVGDIQNLPAKQAVSSGIEKAFVMPNYRVVQTVGIDELSFDLGEGESSTTKDVVSSLIRNLTKNISFETTGVVDTEQKMYQVIPTYRYDSKNLKASASFPFAYDGQKKHLYADFSAMDSFLNAPAHSGKYSRFDLNRFSPQLDKAGEIMTVIKKNTIGLYGSFDEATFSDVALNDDDKSNKVVRKIQVKTSIEKSMELIPNMMADVVKVLKTDNQTADGKVVVDLPADMPDFADPVFKASIVKELSKMIAPGSEQVEVFGFNKHGQVVQADANARIVFTPPKSKYDESPESEDQKPITMAMHSKTRVYDIGTAKLIDAPTAENSVDGFENLKGSTLGKLFLPKEEAKDAEAVEATADEAMDAVGAAVAVDAAKAGGYKSKKSRQHKRR